MNTAEFLRVVDHAAGMNDRWLFLAAFCLLLLLCAVAIWWLVKQLQAVIAHHKQLHYAHTQSLTQIINTQNDTALKLAVCIDRDSAALQECSQELQRVRERNPSPEPSSIGSFFLTIPDTKSSFWLYKRSR